MKKIKIAATKIARLSAVLASVVLASACGGGFDTTPSATAATSTAQGLWIGTTNTGRTATGIVLSDGTFYVLYSLAGVGNATTIAGAVQGTGASNSGTFSSSNARDFNLESLVVLPATVSAMYVPKQSFNATITYAAGAPVATTGTYDADYETVPSLATLAGTYTGQAVTLAGVVANATLTVSTSGAVSGLSAGGCAATGSASPRTDGNAYNMTITFGGGTCAFANQTLSGIGYFNSVAKRLYAAAPNAARDDGVLFVGTKP